MSILLPQTPAKFATLSLLATITFLIVLGQVDAAIIEAKSVSLADVHSAIASAHEGDTVKVPAGTASWTSTLVISKGITLAGANAQATDDRTVIVDDVAASARGTAAIMEAPIKSGQALRISGLTFRAGSRRTKSPRGAAIHIKDGAAGASLRAPCDSLRVDHCHFDRLNQQGIRIDGWFYGVIDHCQWDTAESGNVFIGTISHGRWGGGPNAQGNGSWADPNYFGTEKFIFLEDNVINNNARVVTSGTLDANSGARYVFRHNTVKNTQPVTHGTESGGDRGARAEEIYNNTFNFTTLKLGGQLLRSGTLLIWGNTYTASGTGNHIRKLTVYREDSSSWKGGGASGNNPWDVNDTEGNGTNVPGHKPHLYLSGTHTGASNSTSLQVSGAGWAKDQWVGYSVTNLNQRNRQGFQISSYVNSSTSDTMFFAYNGTGTQLKFNPGDKFEIYRCLIALDQPGRGKGDLLRWVARGSSASYYNTVTGGAAWPHQALEPVYCWNNSVNGALNSPIATVFSPYPTVRENCDYYNYAAAVDGAQTIGVGSGKLADRPARCTPGVAYWATDQGDWDSTHEGPDGQLYVCTAPDTWTLYYKPYIYPHPLVSGVPVPKKTAEDPQHGKGAISSLNK
jgi:hypothetical protein